MKPRTSDVQRVSATRAVTTAAACAGLFVAAGVVHTAIRVWVVDEAYGLSRIETEHRQLVRENAQLEVELASLRAPSRVEPAAHAAGLVRPGPGQIIRISLPPSLQKACPEPCRGGVRGREPRTAAAPARRPRRAEHLIPTPGGSGDESKRPLP